MIKATKPNQTEVLPMNQFNKEIAQALLENTNLTEVFRNQLESTMNSLLESELTAILGYDSYVRFNNGNYHNGDYTRRLDTVWSNQCPCP